MGDLRENAEYQTAKERQSYVQSQLAQLPARLSKLAMVNLGKIPIGKVSYGSTGCAVRSSDRARRSPTSW